MDSLPEKMRPWAQRLLASEVANKSASATGPIDLLSVFEKLRSALAQFVGSDGFAALMRRALAMARREVPSLETAKVTSDGRLEGLQDQGPGVTNHAEAATAITTHLLALLVTFIGEPLTLRLLQEAWPDESHRTTTESEDLS